MFGPLERLGAIVHQYFSGHVARLLVKAVTWVLGRDGRRPVVVFLCALTLAFSVIEHAHDYPKSVFDLFMTVGVCLLSLFVMAWWLHHSRDGEGSSDGTAVASPVVGYALLVLGLFPFSVIDIVTHPPIHLFEVAFLVTETFWMSAMLTDPQRGCGRSIFTRAWEARPKIQLPVLIPLPTAS